MQKVYMVWNDESRDPLFATTDLSLAQEMMCDYFMADLEYEWYWQQKWTPYDDPAELAQMVWENMIEWYDENMFLCSTDLL